MRDLLNLLDTVLTEAVNPTIDQAVKAAGFQTKAGGNFWNIFWRFNSQTSALHGFCYGGKATSAALTQVKFAPTSGNWDAGQVNFKYLA